MNKCLWFFCYPAPSPPRSNGEQPRGCLPRYSSIKSASALAMKASSARQVFPIKSSNISVKTYCFRRTVTTDHGVRPFDNKIPALLFPLESHRSFKPNSSKSFLRRVCLARLELDTKNLLYMKLLYMNTLIDYFQRKETIYREGQCLN